MGFDPFSEKGTPIDKQPLSWSELNTQPYDSDSVHPYSRTRGILMNGIEVDAALFYHQFHRHTDDTDLRRQLAAIRRVEQQQQKAVNWMIPAQESTLQVTIGYEQLAVDLTAAMAKKEPDPNVKAALDFALIEDFDHLYRYANHMLVTEGIAAESLVKDLTEVTPGRPTVVEHLHPFDTVRQHYDRTKAHILTKLHVATITAAEQQTMNYYMNVGNRIADTVGRGLYQEIGQIEEQHVTHYGSLADPRASWFEMAVLHEYNECYLYWSCMQSEVEPRAKQMWERNLSNEIAHLQMAVELGKKYARSDIRSMYPDAFPEPLVLQSSKDYVRKILASQTHFTAENQRYVPLKNAENRDRYERYLDAVNGDEFVPSQRAVEECIRRDSQDYRLETEGDHPVDLLRDRSKVPTPEKLLKGFASR
jgi:rubrerythrin